MQLMKIVIKYPREFRKGGKNMENIYDGALHDITDKISDAHITVNSSGFNNDEILTVVRENGRKDYHILLLLKGGCKVFYENEVFDFLVFYLVLYTPGQKQKYIQGTV